MVRTYENRELAEMYVWIVGRINPSDIHFQEQSEFISSAGINIHSFYREHRKSLKKLELLRGKGFELIHRLELILEFNGNVQEVRRILESERESQERPHIPYSAEQIESGDVCRELGLVVDTVDERGWWSDLLER